MEHIRNQNGLPIDDLSKGRPTNCEAANAEEIARIAASELVVRIFELEEEARSLRRMICYLLTKNESLRQQLEHRKDAEQVPI